LKQYEKAEASYIFASLMIPNKMYSKYLLAILYEEWGKPDEAKRVAENILKMPVKVKTKAISEIQDQMKEILNKQNQ
jgi:hypothetical protein